MKPQASPILTSLLDTDAYKLHMQQAVFHHYRNTTVVAEFRCRSEDALGDYADEIRQQIFLMQDLALTEDEYHYLASLPFFHQDYLDWLKTFRFNSDQVQVTNENGKLQIRITGLWYEAILWEVPLLAVISETIHRHRTPEIGRQQAIDFLHNKLAHFRANYADVDLSQFKVSDFGTRRRYSKDVQQAIVTVLQQSFSPYLIGTSNYDLARRLNLSPIGTQAHEWFQAFQQISPVLANSQRAALQGWLDEYPNQLGIALTDCITMDAFLHDFGIQFATQYEGLRHDSGDPFEWGEKAIAHYQNLAIDPLTKTLVFSDNLDLDKALALYKRFHTRVKLVFGIGTRLTCDIPGVNPLNIVIKLIQCNGKPVAKLSDSPGKTICQDKGFVKALHKAFNLPLVKRDN
ncbi:nicotinate phosphoribosyltransferase [Pragia fontium]|uniref:Nicotinate phosphoribosyltransferase n=1 Tax=Pragia fontium DSM 5563 = ATCC 49100 TaxID=1122977 RepID=A0AAJ4WC06_9GAMM|nr:nicotinate phosphoribosyltransferase [Pragia fontium]SFD13093.1 nicotinate phosphoribosyltransferase [Pragia fontium DSM 5563 = ATCC 49100]SUB82935.1 Nicotinate phosphoribosyltransferase [Pragia fontium]VEJ55835.1 Nicotinate phosphoribosyltransferase [Pragia fontium]